MTISGLTYSNKDEWYTPSDVVHYFGNFDYDPATTKEQAKYLNIPNYDTIETNGLNTDWSIFSKIWINPPFTRKFDFLEKAAFTVKTALTDVYILFPIDSMTSKKFHEIVKKYRVGYTMYIPSGRVNFIDKESVKNSPSFGSVILLLNPDSTDLSIQHIKFDKEM